MSTITLDRKLTTREAAVHIGVKPQTLDVWRSTRRVDLPYLKIGRIVRYRLADVDEWLERCRVTNEASEVTDSSNPAAPARSDVTAGSALLS